MNVKLVFVSIVISLILIVIIYSAYAYFTSPKYVIIKLNNFSKIYSIEVINNKELLLGGVYFLNNNTIPQGVAGIYFLNNNTFLPFNISNYFKEGYIYSLGYNGTFVMIGGSTRINGTLHSSLVGINILTGEIYNLSKIIPSFYTLGQVFAIDWTGKYWLIGGNAYIYGISQSPFLIPFLLKVNSTGFHDLSPDLPSDFKVQGGASTIYYIYSNNNSSSIIVGGNAVNMTATILMNSKFTNISFNFLHLGVLLTAYYWNGNWIIGGENLTNPDNPEPFLAIINRTQAYPINLEYKLGIVTSITSTSSNSLLVSLRVPFITSNGTAYGTVILYGDKINNLKSIFSKPYIVIEELTSFQNEALGVGYYQQGNNFTGIILIFKNF